MELFLLKEDLSFLKPLLRRKETDDISVELSVPDEMPDADSILSVSAVPMMREKEAFLGKMLVSGVCDVCVFYESGEADRTQRLSTTVEFSRSFDCAEITPESLLCARVTVTAADARTVNPRKTAIKLTLCYEAEAYGRSTVSVPYGVSGSDTVEILEGRTDADCVKGVSEKVFSVTDTVRIPSAESVVLGDVEVSVEEVKIVDTKAIVKGTACTTLLVADNEKRVESPFSQVVDLETPDEPKYVTCIVMASGAYATEKSDADPETGEAEIELGLVCQCVSVGQMPVRFIADAYSTKGSAKLTFGEALFGTAPDGGETLNFVEKIEENEREEPADAHSLTLIRAASGDTLWSIAKRFSASKALVANANDLKSDEIEPGRLILVPKR